VELRNLEYFLAVVEHGSLRAAAQQLGVTQPALTKAVRRLEDSFGVLLFERRARGVALTTYGSALVRHARDLRSSVRAAWDELGALRTGSAGLVRVGAGPSWQDTILPEAIASLRADRPGVRVQAVGGSDHEVKAQLKGGGLDLVLAAVPDTPRLEPGLRWRSLLSDEYCVIADAGHPLFARPEVRLEDVLSYPWILPSAASYMVERLRLLLRSRGLPAPEPAIETDVIGLKFALMRGSEYLSFHGATHLAAHNPATLAILDVPGTRVRREAGIITRQKVQPSPATAALIKILERICARGGPP
jgi:DNA-binding transcriptional LysR family regulator